MNRLANPDTAPGGDMMEISTSEFADRRLRRAYRAYGPRKIDWCMKAGFTLTEAIDIAEVHQQVWMRYRDPGPPPRPERHLRLVDGGQL